MRKRRAVNRLIVWPTLVALACVSAYLGFRLYDYRQGESARLSPGEIHTGKPPVRRSIAEPELPGMHRPEFSLPDLDGRLRSISEWDGKVIALNFWATWCPPCLKEIPEFVALQDRYRSQGLQFIGIALQRPEEVRDFVTEKGMNYPVLTGELEVIEVANRYGNAMGALPYTVFIDKNGRVAYVRPGILSTEKAESVITSLL